MCALENDADLNRRRLRRRHLIYYLRVFDQESGELLGHLVDVNRGGIMLISEKSIPLDKEFNLRMDLPVELWGKSHFDFSAKSHWEAQDVNPDFLNTGFEITHVGREEMDIIDRLISEFGFRD